MTDASAQPWSFKTLGESMAVAVQPAEEITIEKKHSTRQRRVVVTGMGVVTPLGHDADLFYSNLLEGISGITEIEAFDCAQFPTVDISFFSQMPFPVCSPLYLIFSENCWRDKDLFN